MNCKKATYLTTKQQEGSISFMEKIQLKFHLLFCKYCSLFKSQTDFIDKNIDSFSRSNKFKMDDDFKSKLQDQLKNKP